MATNIEELDTTQRWDYETIRNDNIDRAHDHYISSRFESNGFCMSTKVIEGLKLAIETKERDKSQQRISTDLTQNGESPPNFQRDYRAAEKIEFMTESKNLKKKPQMTIDFP